MNPLETDTEGALVELMLYSPYAPHLNRQEERMPQRIQRKRTKGWEAPPNSVYVGRPTKWGNRFKVGDTYDIEGEFVHVDTVEQAIELYRRELIADAFLMKQLSELRGKDLVCWCAEGDSCHADVLLALCAQLDKIARAGGRR